MTLIDRYLARTVVVYSLMVLGVLQVLGVLFLFIEEQDDIGVGNYGAADALLFSLLNLPQQAFELMPIAVLIGALLGLGMLARGSELVVLRASGLSIARIAVGVAIGGVFLTLLAALLGEIVAPPLQKFARQQKAFSKFADVSFAGLGNAWVKDGETIMSVQEQSGDNLFGGVFVFRLDGARRITSVGHAERASVTEGSSYWRLEQYVETHFTDAGTDTRVLPAVTLPTKVDPGFLGLAVAIPRMLTSADLLRLMAHLRANGLETKSYEFAFWSRIARTSAIIVVALLAIPFAFGPMRSSGAGARMVIGVLIGVGFFLMQRMLESGAIVFDLEPIVLAWVPTGVLLVLTLGLMVRTR